MIKQKTETLFISKLGGPLTDFHDINIKVSRFFTDTSGTILDKNTVPNNLKKSYPFFLFGQWDRLGGHNIGLQTNPAGLPLYFSGVFGVGVPFLMGTGLNEIQTKLSIGDILTVFTDDIVNPSFYIWMVLHSDNTPLGSMFGNSISTQRDGRLMNLLCKFINVIPDNDLQFNENLNYIRVDNLGNFEQNQISPLIWKTPMTQLDKFIRIKTPFIIDQYLMISSYMQFQSDSLSFTLQLLKK